MQRTSIHFLIALLSGALLALMINLNSQLASTSNALSASWFAHGIGAVCALAIVILYSTINKYRQPTSNAEIKTAKAITKMTDSKKWWHYCGGIPGAFTVVLAAITVNSELGLSGTLALALIGQIIFGFVVDHFGCFGLAKKPFSLQALMTTLPILVGSFMLIFTGI